MKSSPNLFLAHFFSITGSVFAGLAFGSFGWSPSLQPFAALFLLSAILFYVWSSHFWTRKRYETIEHELAAIRAAISHN